MQGCLEFETGIIEHGDLDGYGQTAMIDRLLEQAVDFDGRHKPGLSYARLGCNGCAFGLGEGSTRELNDGNKGGGAEV